jgi:hypothetical protein
VCNEYNTLNIYLNAKIKIASNVSIPSEIKINYIDEEPFRRWLD